MAGRMAEWLGRTVRLLIVGAGLALKAAPGTAGACAIIYGVALFNSALGWVVAGLFLLLGDRRIDFKRDRRVK